MLFFAHNHCQMFVTELKRVTNPSESTLNFDERRDPRLDPHWKDRRAPGVGAVHKVLASRGFKDKVFWRWDALTSVFFMGKAFWRWEILALGRVEGCVFYCYFTRNLYKYIWTFSLLAPIAFWIHVSGGSYDISRLAGHRGQHQQVRRAPGTISAG